MARAVDERLDDLGEKLYELDERLDGLNERLVEVVERLVLLDERLAEPIERLKTRNGGGFPVWEPLPDSRAVP